MVGLNLSKGQNLRYTVTIPSGANYGETIIVNGSGNADLYVRYGSAPTLKRFDCRPYLAGNDERCILSNPKPGTYYILVHGRTNVSGLTLRALWLPEK